MTERDFIYWLQGFLELSNASSMTPEQIKMIKDHLALVMNKATPFYPDPGQFPNYQSTGTPYPISTIQLKGQLVDNYEDRR